MSPDGETEVVLEKPKRAPRKRVPKEVSKESDAPTPVKRARTPRATSATPRKRAPRAKKEELEEEAPVVSRKAPTPIAEEKAKAKRSRKHAIVIGVLILLGIGSSAAVGFTDKGQIDVAMAIQERNKAAEAAGQPVFVIPPEGEEGQVDSGLIGVGDAPAAPQASSTPPATASSTEPAAASSTPPTTETAAEPAAAL